MQVNDTVTYRGHTYQIQAIRTTKDGQTIAVLDTARGRTETVQYIDIKGFVYCSAHGLTRKHSVRCRKLKPAEVKQLNSGKPLTKY